MKENYTKGQKWRTIFVNSAKDIKMSPERLIHRAGEIPSKAFLILEGHVIALYCNDRIKNKVIQIFGVNDIILLDSLICSKESIFKYKTITNVKLRPIAYTEIMNYICSSKFAMQDVFSLICNDADKVILREVNKRDTKYKIAEVFWELYNQLGTDSTGALLIEAKLTQKMIAEYNGLHRISVTNEMKALKEKGLVIYKEGKYYIPDPDALEQYQKE